MKEAIAIIEETITDYRFKADKLEEIVNDLKKLNGAAPDPDPLPPPKYKEVFAVNVERVDVPLKSFAEALAKKEVSETPIQERVVAAKEHIKKTANKRDRDVHTESAVSSNGKNLIPSDLMVLEALKAINKEASTTDVKNELNKNSELPILAQIVENSLKRLYKKKLIFMDFSTKPKTWTVIKKQKPTTAPITKTKFPKVKAAVVGKSSYDDKLKFAESKGYKNVAEAIAAMGSNTFRQEFKKFEAFDGI